MEYLQPSTKALFTQDGEWKVWKINYKGYPHHEEIYKNAPIKATMSTRTIWVQVRNSNVVEAKKILETVLERSLIQSSQQALVFEVGETNTGQYHYEWTGTIEKAEKELGIQAGIAEFARVEENYKRKLNTILFFDIPNILKTS
jgi:hypothetical protein